MYIPIEKLTPNDTLEHLTELRHQIVTDHYNIDHDRLNYYQADPFLALHLASRMHENPKIKYSRRLLLVSIWYGYGEKAQELLDREPWCSDSFLHVVLAKRYKRKTSKYWNSLCVELSSSEYEYYENASFLLWALGRKGNELKLEGPPCESLSQEPTLQQLAKEFYSNAKSEFLQSLATDSFSLISYEAARNNIQLEMDNRNWEGAHALCKSLLVSTYCAETWLNLGDSLTWMHRFDEAFEVANALSILYPGFRQVWLQKFRTEVMLGRSFSGTKTLIQSLRTPVRWVPR